MIYTITDSWGPYTISVIHPSFEKGRGFLLNMELGATQVLNYPRAVELRAAVAAWLRFPDGYGALTLQEFLHRTLGDP